MRSGSTAAAFPEATAAGSTHQRGTDWNLGSSFHQWTKIIIKWISWMDKVDKMDKVHIKRHDTTVFFATSWQDDACHGDKNPCRAAVFGSVL